MKIIDKIYRKELIEAQSLRNGRNSSDITKLMFKLLQNPEWLNSWVRSARGKKSIDKSLAIMRTGTGKHYLSL